MREIRDVLRLPPRPLALDNPSGMRMELGVDAVLQHQPVPPHRRESFKDTSHMKPAFPPPGVISVTTKGQSMLLPTALSKMYETRLRRPWSTGEEAALRRAVADIGPGRWAEILKTEPYKSIFYQQRRTQVNLKDKWRNLMKESGGQAGYTDGAQGTPVSASAAPGAWESSGARHGAGPSKMMQAMAAAGMSPAADSGSGSRGRPLRASSLKARKKLKLTDVDVGTEGEGEGEG